MAGSCALISDRRNSDMWRPYLQVIAARASQAVHIVDRFHIMTKLNQAIDEVRAKEARELAALGEEPLLKHTRWCLLKQPRHLSDPQFTRLAEVVNYNLKTVRSWLLREEFQRFWEYRSPFYAGKFLAQWCSGAMCSRIEPMKKVAHTLRQHRQLILNWFEAKERSRRAKSRGQTTKRN